MTVLAAAIDAIRARRWADMRDMAEAQLALLRAEVQRRSKPAGALVESAPAETNPRSVSAEERKAYRRFSGAVDRAARYGVFRPQCLSSALALSGLLSARGFVAHRIRIGVRKDDTAFTAHAWVELDDELRQNAPAGTLGFTALTSVSARRPTRGFTRNRFGLSWLRRRSPLRSS